MSRTSLNDIWKLIESRDLEDVPEFLTPASDKDVLEKILRDNVFKGTILEGLRPKSLKLLELLGECCE